MIQVIDRVSIVDGVSLEFVSQGRGAGVPIVCLHGVTDSWRSFEPVLAELSPDVEAFALSQRGHGDSDRPETGYAMAELASDVAAFLRSLGIDQAVIVGHSMGAIVAQRFALDFPQMVRGLVLIGSMSNLAGNVDVQQFYQEAIRPLGDEVVPELAREFQVSTLAQPIDPVALDRFIAESLKVPADVWKAAFEGFIDLDLLPELGQIAVPVLILWGDQDAFASRAEQDATVAAFPNGRLVVFPGNGHAVHWEVPNLIAREIELFVSNQ